MGVSTSDVTSGACNRIFDITSDNDMLCGMDDTFPFIYDTFVSFVVNVVC